MATGYWGRRIPRRRAVAGAAVLGAGAATISLVGCGGGEGSPAGGSDALISEPRDRTKEASPGGEYRGVWTRGEPQGFDPIGAFVTMYVAYSTYCRLLKKKTTYDGKIVDEAVGDLAESWEMSNDGLQMTLRLRQGMIFDRRAPTNGRAVDSQDVKFSADRFLALSPYAENFFRQKSEVAPIERVETPDPRTVVLKLAFPYAPLFAILSRGGNIWILPREAGAGFDPKKEVRGAGPWILDNYQASALLTFRRNPDWYVKERPFFDRWSAPIIPEYATQLAQFRAGNIWSGVVRQQDILATKKDLPKLQMFQGEYGTGTPLLAFGLLGPFKDPRVRQATSMVIDRKLYAETVAGVDEFEAAGVPVSVRYNSHIGAGWAEWLDPFGKDFGQNNRYYQYDVAEARKLLTAAGISGKLRTKITISSTTATTDRRPVETLAGMLSDSGLFDVTINTVDGATVFTPQYQWGKGQYEELSLTPAAQGDDAGHQTQIQYHPTGTVTRVPPGFDPKLEKMIEDQVKELDPKKRASMIHELQRYLAGIMIAAPYSYQVRGFQLFWPAVGNAGAVVATGRGAPDSEVYPYYWYDRAAVSG